MKLESKWYNQEEYKVQDYLKNNDIFLAKCINTINNDIYIRTARIVSYGLKYELSIGLCNSKLIGWHPIVQPNEKKVHL